MDGKYIKKDNDQGRDIVSPALFFPSRSASETSMVTKKPSGIETIPEFSNGNIAPVPMTVGLIRISPIDTQRPVTIPATIQFSVLFFQKSVHIRAGIFALAAIANARPTRNATF